MAEEKKFLLSEIEGLRVLGRTTKDREPLVLFWTGSGFETDYTGTELWCEFETDYTEYEQWIAVIINGALIARQMLPKGKHKLCLFRNLQTLKKNHVKVVKEVQAMPEDETAYLAVHALYGDGSFSEPEAPSRRIEFVGDSITSGEGSYGATCEEDWISMWFSTTHTYPYLVSERLNAEYRTVSQSGYGVCCAWNNNPDNVIPAFYEQICGVLSGKRNEKCGAKEAYDFSEWQPDYVVINLGTNDQVAFSQPEWYDEATGRRKKMQMDRTGFPVREAFEEIKGGVATFLETVRKNNPTAKILWCYGMMGELIKDAITEGISMYRTQSGDTEVYFVPLTEIAGEAIGARSHPGLAGHKRAAEEICNKICRIEAAGK
ncbi:MAG: GDSL family lipase [Lachnospiraceae bacterium]|nr:GDSL family lipase [Lachnospiraceae bacterium]